MKSQTVGRNSSVHNGGNSDESDVENRDTTEDRDKSKHDENKENSDSGSDTDIGDKADQDATKTLSTLPDVLQRNGKEIITGSYQPDRITSERVIKDYVKSYLFKYVSLCRREVAFVNYYLTVYADWAG